MEIKNVTIIGCGQMGKQIALNTAIYGFKACVYDINGEALATIPAWAKEYLAGRVAKGKMTQEDADKALANFSIEADVAKAVKDADLVIEAVLENFKIKQNLFKQLSDLVREDTIIATNSSYMVSSMFKDDVKNPERLLNCHFYNPALVMKFVEVVKGDHTSLEVAQTVYDFCVKTGKTPILMKKEISGFAANYLLSGLSRNAMELVDGGYCTPQDVDIACEQGLNHPMGPFKVMDFTGLDIAFNTLDTKYKKTGVKPPMYDYFEKLVKEGKLGRKSGEGFYKY